MDVFSFLLHYHSCKHTIVTIRVIPHENVHFLGICQARY
jgi:hypothetical protein